MVYTIFGLGNPGSEYAQTRHNIGQMVVAEIVRRAGTSLSLHKQSNTQAASLRIGVAPGNSGAQVIVGISTGYMNTSGGPVSSLLHYFGGEAENLIVIHDDLDLPFGELKLKRGGGEGGHNGLKSITKSLGTKNYIRLRFGIGRPPGRQNPADFVLGRFNASENKELPLLISAAADAVEEVLTLGLEKAQMRLHTK